ncbi:MAG: TonB-dependent receptor [Acidobacteriia bacterium]|nr:TonB-dependent receptor [Terriglobia bacterium]
MGTKLYGKFVFLQVLVVAMLAASICFAQVGTGRLDGGVADTTGGVMPGAKITATNHATQAKAETTTNADGNFVFPSLQPGFYTVSVEAKGFRTAVVDNVEINVATAVTQRFKLEVGEIAEHVQVQAEQVRVQTSEAQVGRTVTLKDIDTLPVLGRAPINLVVFSPGIQMSNPGDVTFSNVNGQRQGASNATLDGIDVNDAVVPRLGLSMTANNTDSVAEVHMVTTAAKAEYGRNAGGQLELITRSGSNSFHGNLFDYLRNNDLNANSFFNNSSTPAVPVAKYIQNLFGGSVGGPVRKNKTFFFFNYQGSRISQDVTRNRTVLTAAAKRGIFTWKTPAGVLSTYDIVANDPRHVGIDPAMAAIFKVLPDPNNLNAGDTLNTAGFQFNNPAGSWNNSYTGKADHNLTENIHLFFRYSWFRTYSIDSLNNADATFPGFPQGNQGGVRWGFSTGADWAITPTLINELRVGHQSAGVDFNRPGRLQGPTVISNLFTDPYASGFAQGRNSPVNEVTDYLTKVKGSHTLKFGANVRLTEQWGYNLAGTGGGIYPNVTTGVSFGNNVPTTVGPTGSSISSANRTTFESLYNDVLGRMNSVVQSYFSDLTKFQAAGTSRIRDFNVKEMGLFAQDDWKIRRNLTLNLGLRWEFSGIPSEASGLVGTIDQAAALSTMYSASNLTVKKGGQWYNNDWNNFAPRIGFAWDVKGDSKTVVRSSIGVFYDRMIGATISAVDGATPGFGQDVQVFPNANGTDVRVNDGIPGTPQPAAPLLTLPNTRSTTIDVFNPNLRTPYVAQYVFNVQRELPLRTVLEVGYVGSRGIKLFMAQNLNQQKIFGSDFLKSFQELQAFQANSSALPSAGNTLVKIFGTPAAAISALGATTVSQGQVGSAATTTDRTNFAKYVAAGVPDNYLRNFPQYISVLQGTNSGRSYYNSLQVTLRRQFRDLMILGNYTWAKSMDNSSVEGNGFASPIDSFNLALSRARSDFDRPHSFNGSFAYTLPVGKGKKFGGTMPHIMDTLIGGWEVGSLVIWQSGGPFTISSGRNTTYGLVNSQANYTGSRNVGTVTRQGNGVWFYPQDTFATNFTFPIAGDFGNTGRNTFRGPRYFDTDVSLVKRFRIYEKHAITFRAEAYNIFNDANFGNPTVSLTTPQTFGKLTSIVGSPRIVQLALRYDF